MSNGNVPPIDSEMIELTRQFAASLPVELADALRAAAVPHWFDSQILSVISGTPISLALDLCHKLQQLPIVQPWAGNKHSVHELTRQAILVDLWDEQTYLYRLWSRRAASYFANRADNRDRIEGIYHLLLGDPEQGADQARNLGLEWRDSFQYHLLHTLVQVGLEHIYAGRLVGRARGWIYFLKSQYHLVYSENLAFRTSVETALKDAGSDRFLEASCLQGIGDAGRLQDDYALADRSYGTALDIFQEIGQRRNVAWCLWGLGDIYWLRSEYSQAQGRYEEALAIFREVSDYKGEATCLRALGHIHQLRGEYDTAQKYHTNALRVFRSLGDWQGEAWSLWGLGDVYRKQGELTLAHNHYQQALEIYRKIGHRQGEAWCLWSLGDVNYLQGHYEQAQGFSQTALEIFREIGDLQGEVWCLWSLGELQSIQNEYTSAAEYYKNALEISRKIAHRWGEGRVLASMGILYNKQGYIEQAETLWREALSILESIGASEAEQVRVLLKSNS